MLRFVPNNYSSMLNDHIELKWTTYSKQIVAEGEGEGDLVEKFYEPSNAAVESLRNNWSIGAQPLTENLLEKLNTIATTTLATTSSYLSSTLPLEESIDLSIMPNNNESDYYSLSSVNQTKSDITLYYFYKQNPGRAQPGCLLNSTETLTFLWVIFAMILCGNCSVLITLLMSKNRKTRMNFFIMHLAIADLTVGLINVATDIAWKTTVGFYAGNVACKVVRFSQVFVTYSSTYVLVALSIDRYDAITHPLNFSGSWKRARILVGSSWALSAIFSIPAIFLNEETIIENRPQCWIKLDQWQWQIYITLVAVSLFFLPAIIITACYSIIVHTIWSKSKMMTFPKSTNKSKHKTTTSSSTSATADYASQQQRSSNSNKYVTDSEMEFKRASSRGIIPKAKIKTVKMTFVIVFVFILCWSPYFVWDLLQVYGAIPDSQTTIAISTFIQSLAPLNSAANPLIYFLFSTHFFRNLRKLHLLRICCNYGESREDNSKRINYNTINSSGRSSARTATQRISMTSKMSPKASTLNKSVIISDVNKTHLIHHPNDQKASLTNSSNSVV